MPSPKPKSAAVAATPPYCPSDDQIDRVLRSLPALIADARPAWRRSHRKWIIKEFTAFHPADAIEAMLVEHIIALRHMASHMMRWSALQSLSLAEVCRQDRGAVGLMRVAKQAEATLRRAQKSAARGGGAGKGAGR